MKMDDVVEVQQEFGDIVVARKAKVKFDALISTPGVYSIRNTVNGRLYIGSSVNLRSRVRDHFSMLLQGAHPNVHLQRAWNKYGGDAFEVSVVEACKVEDLIKTEQFWIDRFQVYRGGYNRRPVAQSNLGLKWPEDVRKKMVKHLFGNKYRAGVPHSQETKDKISKGGKGRVVSAETRRKISVNNPMHRPEVRAKVSGKNSSMKMPGVAAKAAASNRGQKRSIESRLKMSLAQLNSAARRKKSVQHSPVVSAGEAL